MKIALTLLAMLIGAVLICVAARSVNRSIAPLLLHSRLERLGETNLPRISVQGGTVYCRMKADDFRFPLPPGSRAVNPVVTGGFDTVNGSVEAHFDGTNRITANEYEAYLSGKVQIGGRITVQAIWEGLFIKFQYFGDR